MANIEFFKDGDHMAIRTDAVGPLDFVSSCASALAELIESKKFEGDWSFQLDRWLPQIIDIHNSLSDYKTGCTVEKVTTAGDGKIIFSDLVYSHGSGHVSVGVVGGGETE